MLKFIGNHPRNSKKFVSRLNEFTSGGKIVINEMWQIFDMICGMKIVISGTNLLQIGPVGGQVDGKFYRKFEKTGRVALPYHSK